MSHNLILSHPKDYERVFVPKHITKKLNKYNIQMIRDVYYCMSGKKQGIVINLEKEMDWSLSIAAYLRAICNCKKYDTPILIISSDENYAAWHLNLRTYSGLDLYILTEQNANNLFNKNEQIAILMKSNLMKLLDSYKDMDFFIVIVDDIDQLVTKRIFNRLGGSFNIGITHTNFYKNRDQKVLWKVLNWIGDKSIGKFKQFPKLDEEFLNLITDPYQESWFRYTWVEYEKPDLQELQVLDKKLQKWSIDNNLTPPSSKTRASKRKNTDNTPETKKKTFKLEDKNKSTDCIDVATELSEIQELARTNEDIWVSLKYPSKSECMPKTQLSPKKSPKLRKHKSASNLEYIDKFVIDEFENEFAPKKKFSRNKSDTFYLNKHKFIDKDVLEEFSKDFYLEHKERKTYHAKMDFDILSGVSNILNKTETVAESTNTISANILSIDEIFKNSNEKIISATKENTTVSTNNLLGSPDNSNSSENILAANHREVIHLATQEVCSKNNTTLSNNHEENSILLGLLDLSSSSTKDILPAINEEIFPASQEVSNKINTILPSNDAEKSILLNLLDLNSHKENNLNTSQDETKSNSSQKVLSGKSMGDILSDLFLEKSDLESTTEVMNNSDFPFSELVDGNNIDPYIFKEKEHLIMKKQILNSLFGNDDFL